MSRKLRFRRVWDRRWPRYLLLLLGALVVYQFSGYEVLGDLRDVWKQEAEVRQKIEARYAKARGSAELTESSVASRMREIEAATANVEAKSRLSAMKVELGLAKGPSPEELLAASAPDADEEAEVVASEGDVPPAG